CVSHQVLQQAVFLAGQLNSFSAAPDLLGKAVKLNVADSQYRFLPGCAAPEQRFDSDQEFSKRKRLRQVVIGAGFEVSHLILYGVASGQNQNWNLAIGAPNLSQNLRSIHAWKQEIQNDEVIAVTLS